MPKRSEANTEPKTRFPHTLIFNGLEVKKLAELSSRLQENKAEVLRKALRLYYFLKMRNDEDVEIKIVTKNGEGVKEISIPPEFI